MDVELRIGSQRWSGWKKIEVRRGIDRLAGTFQFESTSLPAGIRSGDACSVLLDGVPLMHGHVDDVDDVWSKNRHDVVVRGRDKTADLVDCSVVHHSGQFKDRTLMQVADTLTRLFGLSVSSNVDTGGAFKSPSVQQGETVFELLERLARIRGVLLTSNGLDGMHITRASDTQAPTALVGGENILASKATGSWRDRYSRYVVMAQQTGDDKTFGAASAQVQTQITDAGITRERPLVVLAEDVATQADVLQRAHWEKQHRRGRGFTMEVTVQGWRHAAGLWQPNTNVAVRVPSQRVDATLLIEAVTYLLDAQGERAMLHLVHPDAYSLIPHPETPDDGGAFT